MTREDSMQIGQNMSSRVKHCQNTITNELRKALLYMFFLLGPVPFFSDFSDFLYFFEKKAKNIKK